MSRKHRSIEISGIGRSSPKFNKTKNQNCGYTKSERSVMITSSSKLTSNTTILVAGFSVFLCRLCILCFSRWHVDQSQFQRGTIMRLVNVGNDLPPSADVAGSLHVASIARHRQRSGPSSSTSKRHSIYSINSLILIPIPFVRGI